MHRLLQGDVGSGKTVVAALAAARAIDAGWQCALMAPTEILAEQHLKKLVGWLAPLGVTVAWLTGSRKGKERDEMLAQVASGGAGARRRHARRDRGAGALRTARPRDHRRAAPLRRRAAAGAACQAARTRSRSSEARASSAHDERHAHSAHAGDDALRRSRRQHDRRAAAGPDAGRHQALRRHAPQRGDRAHPRRGRSAAGRRTGSVRWSTSRRRST